MNTDQQPDAAPRSFRLRGHCMDPFIKDGSALIVRDVNGRTVSVGDVLTHLSESGGVVAHRVVEIQDRPDSPVIVTKGDAVSRRDRVPADAVMHVVERVEHPDGAYDTGGLVGRMMAWGALRRGVRMRIVRGLVKLGWSLSGRLG